MVVDHFRKFRTSPIEEGDLVMAYMSRDSIVPLTIESDKILNNRYGNYAHADMIGMNFGSQMASKNKTGFIYLLHPTPELWTLALPHRTQILYAPDISYIISKLRITPGSRVIEAGTGSGSFTHSFARTIGDQGELYTFEFHEKRCETARAEFESHGLLRVAGKEVIRLTHRDVCKNGFALPDLQYSVDAVFLDLPAPWEAVPHLTPHLAKTTRLCCFSPCIEQVQRTVITLKTEGWLEIDCYEIAAREWESRYVERKDISEAVEKLREIKRRRISGVKKDRKPAQRIKEGQAGMEWNEIAKPQTEIKSHTSFLLFAIKHDARDETAV